jgi:hypothetical protein
MSTTPFNHRVTLSPEIEEINAKRLFVFAEARSGSTWLINTLNSHQDITMLDEILNPDFVNNFHATRNTDSSANLKGSFRFIESYLGHLPGRFEGCKILFPQAVRFLDFYEFLLNYRNSMFILLYRKNSVKAEISGLIANKHARWHLVEKKEKQSVTVNPAFLYDRLLWRKHTTEFCMNLIQAYCPHVQIIEYDSFFADTTTGLQPLLSMIGVNLSELQCSNEIKSNPFPLRELLDNYEQCLDFFSDKTDFLRMFTE